MKQPLLTAILFGLASYAVAITASALACGVWLELFTVPRGTAIRPMFHSALSLLLAGGGTVLALGLAIACVVIGRRRVPAWVVIGRRRVPGWVFGVPCVAFALLPLPLSMGFFYWVVELQGLTLKM